MLEIANGYSESWWGIMAEPAVEMNLAHVLSHKRDGRLKSIQLTLKHIYYFILFIHVENATAVACNCERKCRRWPAGWFDAGSESVYEKIYPQ